jgi:hypothetical protein
MRLDQIIGTNSDEGGQHDQLQRLVAEGRAKQAEMHLIAPQAREAINTEIIPQVEETVTNMETLNAVTDSLVVEIETAFKNKNQVYTRLVRYKSIDQSDSQYAKDLVAVMGEWQRSTAKTLADGDKPGDETTKQEVTIKVEIDGADKVQTTSETEVGLRDTDTTEDIEVAPESPFDLIDIRL